MSDAPYTINEIDQTITYRGVTYPFTNVASCKGEECVALGDHLHISRLNRGDKRIRSQVWYSLCALPIRQGAIIAAPGLKTPRVSVLVNDYNVNPTSYRDGILMHGARAHQAIVEYLKTLVETG